MLLGERVVRWRGSGSAQLLQDVQSVLSMLLVQEVQRVQRVPVWTADRRDGWRVRSAMLRRWELVRWGRG